jgi:sensor histidine kinase YesM
MCSPGTCQRCGRFSGIYGHFCVQGVKFFDSALSDDEILAEFRRWTPRRPWWHWRRYGLLPAQAILLVAMAETIYSGRYGLWLLVVLLWVLTCWLQRRR